MRPYVIINAAMSADGKLATRERKQTKISGPDDFLRVDTLRAESDAVMVGIGTVLSDDPSLRLKSEEYAAVRKAGGKDPHPMRVVIDSMARMPADGDMFKKGLGRVVIFVSEKAPKERCDALKEKATVISAGADSVDLVIVLDELAKLGVQKLMVEGGATLLWSFLSKELFDEIRIYIGALIIGGKDAPTFADGAGFTDPAEFTRLSLKNIEKIDDGVLLTWIKKV
ncbi:MULTISPECIES: 2,5-diamino-6-(ribosylamino)-4(3H)-pyrimidinone 5'-phosphate reductase [Methanocorpusculum]|jgi:2,5-diamino-6-(ribosylamino)-4(3H)-pyrimidinone 5'-phosphate reductase|uniref:2,5-diamino-6-(ribosylamino)-4(3H)-pyrimidinone 5'-phosphate reductase n=1 Tax=Methanocorpusculum parvum TaxID=2193 RepID=A0AAX0Q7J4_9EURY|nr:MULTISPECIES: 2,5-diamino-6-(ribosylamino)-4(3H)-pyrimidinone 5'-phosphate reductase [Methanocorpusculum]MDD2248878.1 2,5-diamino-6-(ribosylamino)-4(3H)-pyrimidinone 5'-phosphate reductase [Methanocorpusculum sp.]MDD2803816.1 2,5-diamino-6-(ribosylamino)-4(3H)-pyrimidinone 5'-phosphate reductase [Methanocorpusculum sp.]MDD3047337.1 2,5-diamino-6-(ribosylamino)-4(3H)-pyrimidinone 5'-phosphate reductase [Methanocorpusculum sp.]MDD3912404.1 2,5-diamino-6-(ribosylamino)-4(3H)-pyrimidinone 5'-pho